MKQIFINLKRFDVPKSMGGLCPEDDAKKWIQNVIAQTVALGLGRYPDIQITYLLPEMLLYSAVEQLKLAEQSKKENLFLGCQGVHWKDVQLGGNFGAFTTSLPAAAAKMVGVDWAIIGHSEERRDKQEIMQVYDPETSDRDELKIRAARAVDKLINQEVHAAFSRGISVLFCLGESAAERGGGTFEEQQPRIQQSLYSQLVEGLKNITEYDDLSDKFVIGYEPIWAIGPGKTPPNGEYIAFVSRFIKQTVQEELGFNPQVVYGGGLKKENASMIAGVETLDGGLIALTRFVGEIGFDVEQLKEIVDTYRGELGRD
jgi:triosephosphate isomerase